MPKPVKAAPVARRIAKIEGLTPGAVNPNTDKYDPRADDLIAELRDDARGPLHIGSIVETLVEVRAVVAKPGDRGVVTGRAPDGTFTVSWFDRHAVDGQIQKYDPEYIGQSQLRSTLTEDAVEPLEYDAFDRKYDGQQARAKQLAQASTGNGKRFGPDDVAIGNDRAREAFAGDHIESSLGSSTTHVLDRRPADKRVEIQLPPPPDHRR